MDALITCQHGAEALAPIGPVHVCPPLAQLHAKSLIHRQGIEVAPAFGDCAVLDTGDERPQVVCPSHWTAVSRDDATDCAITRPPHAAAANPSRRGSQPPVITPVA